MKPSLPLLILALTLATTCSAQVVNMRSFHSRISYDGTTQERDFVQQCNLQIEETIDYQVVSGTVDQIHRAIPVNNYMWSLNEVLATTPSGTTLTTLRTGMSAEFTGIFVHQHAVPEMTAGDNITVVYTYSPMGSMGSNDGRTLFEGTELKDTAYFALGLFDRSSTETATAVQDVSDISVTTVVNSPTADYFATMAPLPASGELPLSVVKTNEKTEVTITHPGVAVATDVPSNGPLLYQFWTEPDAAKQCGRLSSVMVAAIWFSIGLSLALCIGGAIYVRRKDAENWGRHVAEQRALERKRAGDGGSAGARGGSTGSKRGAPGGGSGRGSGGSRGSRGSARALNG